MPVFLESKAEDNETDAADQGCWVCDYESGFGVQAAGVSFDVEAAYGVVQEVAGEPADEDADDAEEVEVAYAESIGCFFSFGG